jgi:hypothetical protein
MVGLGLSLDPLKEIGMSQSMHTARYNRKAESRYKNHRRTFSKYNKNIIPVDECGDNAVVVL